ncbi:MAG: adenylate/guanylate cyclase domain-containing protein [Saprospiraceae bacterium]
MSKRQRRLAAIMFTDIVGYSAMMQKDEVITSRLRNRHREVFTRLTEQYDGEILQYYGDGTLSIFYSTAAAVECAVDIQRELKQDPKVPLRIGIHTGDITFSNEDVFGDGVNIASRVESLCVPGGIFVTGKVYDDIKNHPTIRATSVGDFGLKNIKDNTSIYAISNPGITVPSRRLESPISRDNSSRSNRGRKTKKKKAKLPAVAKSKETATKLAFPFGLFGVHRFYLGQKLLGILYPLFFIIGIVEGEALLICAPPIISFLDMLLFKSMSEEEFDAKYNKNVPAMASAGIVADGDKNELVQKQQLSSQKSYLKAQFVRHKRAGENYLNEYDYATAIEEFIKANELKYDDAPVHFYLARCYSMMEDTKNALIHLDAAIAFGIPPRQINATNDLAFLRMQPDFQTFEASNYRFQEEGQARKTVKSTKKQTPPKPKVVDMDAPPPDFLEKLQKLSELREKGYLTEEEFVKQKEKLRLK